MAQRRPAASAQDLPGRSFVAEVAAHYDNPFDPEQILDGIITSPDGDEVRAPGFFYVPLPSPRRGPSSSGTGPSPRALSLTVEGAPDRLSSATARELLGGAAPDCRAQSRFRFVRAPWLAHFIYDDGRPFFAG